MLFIESIFVTSDYMIESHARYVPDGLAGVPGFPVSVFAVSASGLPMPQVGKQPKPLASTPPRVLRSRHSW
jgi:hypothetical protein